jgi:WD40 repeat protein
MNGTSNKTLSNKLSNHCDSNLTSKIHSKYSLSKFNLHNISNKKFENQTHELDLTHNNLNSLYIQALKFNPNYNNILAFNSDTTLKIISVKDEKNSYSNDTVNNHKIDNNSLAIDNNLELNDHFFPINTMCWSENGRFLSTGGNDGMTNIYDIEKGTLIRNMIQEETRSAVTCLDFNYSNNLLLAGVYDRQITLYDVRMAKQAYRILAHSEPVTSVSFSEDSKTYISTSYDGFIRVWDLFKGVCQKTIALEKSPCISKAIFLPDQDFIMVSSLNNEINLLNILTEEVLFKYNGHKNENFLLDFDIIAKSSNSLSTYNTNKMEVDDLSIVNEVNYFTDSFSLNKTNLNRYTGDDLILVSGSEDGNIYFWDVSNQSKYFKYSTKSDYLINSNIIQNLSVSTNSDILAVVDYDTDVIKHSNPDNEYDHDNIENNNIQLETDIKNSNSRISFFSIF